MLALLRSGEPLAEARALEELSAVLPDEKPQQLLHTMVPGGRYAGLLDYDLTGKRLLLPRAGNGQRA
jgi:hypothetical protein